MARLIVNGLTPVQAAVIAAYLDANWDDGVVLFFEDALVDMPAKLRNAHYEVLRVLGKVAKGEEFGQSVPKGGNLDKDGEYDLDLFCEEEE